MATGPRRRPDPPVSARDPRWTPSRKRRYCSTAKGGSWSAALRRWIRGREPCISDPDGAPTGAWMRTSVPQNRCLLGHGGSSGRVGQHHHRGTPRDVPRGRQQPGDRSSGGVPGAGRLKSACPAGRPASADRRSCHGAVGDHEVHASSCSPSSPGTAPRRVPRPGWSARPAGPAEPHRSR